MPNFIQGGPEIPDEVMRAKDEGRLVLFCGAGISKGTGLPGFRELFEQTAYSLNFKLENTHDIREDFDRAFHQLEKEYSFEIVRRKVIEILSKDVEPEYLELHKLLVELAKSPDGNIRLVTTNYDDRFQRALDLISEKVKLFDAPALCLATRESWNGIVYLHGRINKIDDPNGRQLVLTSGDFGRAYMYDAWATRFVVEMFRNFVVLFVGYRIEDQILRYMLDALSIENRHTSKLHFALVGAIEDKLPETKAAWRAKGVEPLTYHLQPGDIGRHGKLSDTLAAWAKHSRTGQMSRAQMALTPMQKTYSPSILNDELKNIVWALSESDGTIARALAEARPVPDVGWLDPILNQALPLDGLRQMPLLLSDGIDAATPDNARKYNRLVGNYATSSNRDLKPVERWIAIWLLQHLDKRKLIDWVVENDGVVNAEFSRFIADKIREDARKADPGKQLNGVYSSFWRIVSWGFCIKPPLAKADYVLLWSGDRSFTREEWHIALSSFRPFIHISSHFSAKSSNDAPTALRDLASFEIAVADERGLDGALTILDRLHRNKYGERLSLVSYADEVVSTLVETVRLADIAEIGEVLRYSSLVVPKVWEGSEYETSRGVGKIAALVRYCIQQSILNADDSVLSIFQRLSHFFTVIRANLIGRFVVWIACDSNRIEVDTGVNLLLSSEAGIFWNTDFKLEILRFLKRRASELNEVQQNNICDAIRARLVIVETEGEANRDGDLFDVMQRLIALQDGGFLLPTDLKERLSAWLDGRERATVSGQDEANIGTAYAVQIIPENADHLIDQSYSKIYDSLLATDGLGVRGNMLSDLFRRAPEKAIRVFERIVSEGKLEEFSSHLGIEFVFEDENTGLHSERFEAVCAILTQIEKPWMRRLRYEVPEFLCRAAGKVPPAEVNEDLFTRVWKMAWQNCQDEKSGLLNSTDGLMEAINSPSGRLVEALCSKLWSSEPVKDGLLPPTLRVYFDIVISEDSLSGRFGRIILCSYLVSFHLIDPVWVRTKLLPKMHWHLPEATHLWNSYLHSGRWSHELISDISIEFGAIAQNLDRLRDGPRRNFVSIFMFSFVQFPSVFATQIVQRILTTLQSSDVKHMAWDLQRWLRDSKDKAPALWSETISPFVTQFWPRRTDQISGDTSISLAKMVCATNVKFPDAVRLVLSLGLLQRADNTHTLLHTLCEAPEEINRSTGLSHLVEKYPNDLLLLLDRLVSERLVSWEKSDLGKLVVSLEAKGVPQNDPKLERLRRIALTI